MACCALTSRNKNCRNWSCVDNKFCFAHKNIKPEILKQRWFNRYILTWSAYTVFNNRDEGRILSDLASGNVVLTTKDILKIPARDRYADVYLLFMKHGYVERGTHTSLEFIIFNLYTRIIVAYPPNHGLAPLRELIEQTLILSSGQAFYDYLMWLGPFVGSREQMMRAMVVHIPTLLDSAAAKELSWFPRDELDKLRVHYEKVLGKEHPMTKCLVERWLLDLKELYQTEKAIQKLKMDQCKEELMMDRWHPSRLEKYLEMGFEIDQLDDIM